MPASPQIVANGRDDQGALTSSKILSLTANRFLDAIERQAVDHVLPLQPSFPGDLHPKPEVFESRRRMSIRVDRTENPFGFC